MEVDAAPALVAGEPAKEAVPRGMAKSGRWWKTTRDAKTSAIVKDKPLKTSWQKKMDLKAKNENVKKLQQQIRDRMANEKIEKKERKIEQEKRRKENERKAEVVQVIKNSHKIKKAKKKQLRRIEKRDTNPVVPPSPIDSTREINPRMSTPAATTTTTPTTPPTPIQGGSHWAKSGEEEDRVETLIRGSGCWDQHIGVVDCMSDTGDWRRCQKELGAFRECMLAAQLANKKKADEAKKAAESKK